MPTSYQTQLTMPTYEQIIITPPHLHPDISDAKGSGVYRGYGQGRGSYGPLRGELDNPFPTKKSCKFCEYCGRFGWFRSEGIHYCRIPYRLKPMAYQDAPIVLSLIKWSCPNKIGVNPFLPPEIVRIIAELTLVMNRKMLMSVDRADTEQTFECGSAHIWRRVALFDGDYGNGHRILKYVSDITEDEHYVDQFPN